MPIQEELLERVLQSPRLPSIPAVALKIIELVQQDEVDMDEIAESIRMDAALSTKILKTVNSSFYGQPNTISTISQSLVVLGLNSVKTLALGFSLVGNLTDSGGEGLDHVAFWKRSLFGATAAKQLCDLTGLVQAEEVFMAALLQDVGVLAMGQVLGSEYGRLLTQSASDHRLLSGLEREALSGDHAEVGAALAERWGLPPVLAEPIRFHETPDDAPEIVSPLVRAVAAGGGVADLLMFPDQEPQVSRCRECLEAWYGLEDEKADAFIAECHRQAAEVQRLFELPVGELGSAEDILCRANEALEQIGLQSAEQTQKLEQNNRQLQAQVNTDALTGIGNRRCFDQHAGVAFAAASADKPLSVLFLDIDHFKQFNDEHGHAVGDHILQQFAKAMTKVGESIGEPYRYGGEEFAMICQGMGRKQAAEFAEMLREAIDKEVLVQVDDGSTKNVTASIGVATYEGAFFKRPEQLVRAADRGVYAAKRAGRNCVRVFVPKADTKADAA